MSKENHLTEKALAQRWGFSPRTVQKWRWSNSGPAYIKISGRIRYTKEAVEDFENKNLHLSSMKSREVSYV